MARRRTPCPQVRADTLTQAEVSREVITAMLGGDTALTWLAPNSVSDHNVLTDFMLQTVLG